MELLLKGSTKIQQSPKKFDVPQAKFVDDGPMNITPSKLPEMKVYDRVTVKVDVCFVSEIIIAGNYRKQDISIADATGTGSVSLCENDIGLLKQHTSNILEGFYVREFSSKK